MLRWIMRHTVTMKVTDRSVKLYSPGQVRILVMLRGRQGFRGSRSVQLVIHKARMLHRQATRSDGKLIRIDLDFKNAFNSAGQ